MSREAKLAKREKKLAKLAAKRGGPLKPQTKSEGEAFHIARHVYVMKKMQEKFAKEQALKRLLEEQKPVAPTAPAALEPEGAKISTVLTTAHTDGTTKP
jgi:hypothetical protein